MYAGTLTELRKSSADDEGFRAVLEDHAQRIVDQATDALETQRTHAAVQWWIAVLIWGTAGLHWIAFFRTRPSTSSLTMQRESRFEDRGA